MAHSLTLKQDEEGWDVPWCSCGWSGPPCPDKEIAAEFFTDHAMQVDQAAQDLAEKKLESVRTMLGNFDPTSGVGRTRAFVSDLWNIVGRP